MTRPSNAVLISRACSTPEAKAARRENAKASWADPEVRARRIAALKASAAKGDVKRRRRVAIVLAKREPAAREQARRNCSKSHSFASIAKELAAAVSSTRRQQFIMRDAGKPAAHLFAFAAYRASLAASAIEGGVEASRAMNPAAWCFVREAGKPAARCATARLGGLAQYLAVTAFGVPRHLLASACDLDRRFMRRVCNRIEDARDDADTDALLTRIEARLQ
jgi:hypothetical protein